MSGLGHRRARLQRAVLYLVCPARPGGRALEDVLVPALAGGVDIVQLRDKQAGDDELLVAAAAARALCDAAGALLILNDRPDLVAAARADGCHVGQEDMDVARARELAGPGALVGRSTHSPADIAAAADADYIGVGPVNATPTKPGRPSVGLELVRHAAAHAPVPFFAIGGIDESNVAGVVAAGATRIAVVRAIAEAADPRAAARGLRAILDGELVHGRA
ncbi:MAG TPA: thiamine phosphate synthase [Solirubrobacteraceae bacterium]|nr:thiamine phosphate synthase [Solirubrobacteraceae bacterium]